MRFLFLLIFSVASISAECQTISIFDSTGKEILILKDDQLFESENQKPIFTIKGNIIFTGASSNQKDMRLLVNSENIFSKKRSGTILNARQDSVLFTVRNGVFFYRQSSAYDSAAIVARYEKNELEHILFSGNSDSILCKFSAETTTGKLVAVLFYFDQKLQLSDQIKQKLPLRAAPEQPEFSGGSGSIRRLWNTGMDDFVWDGYVFKRRWNSFDYEEWTFDGYVLKRLWYPGNDEFVWDGETLARRWYSSYDEFEWDGTILRRKWGQGTDEFIIQGNIVKRYFDSSGRDEWQIEGDIPIPLIALVVFGLLRK